MGNTDVESREDHTRHAESPVPGPEARQYAWIGVFVAVLTGIEVGLYYASHAGLRSSVALVGILVTMTVKLVVGAAWFMHLRSDHRVYRQIVVGGLALSAVVLAVAVAIMLFAAVPEI